MADDWDKVTIIRKSKPTSKDMRSSSVINKAMATGNVEITKKGKGLENERTCPNFTIEKYMESAAHLAKIENSEETKGIYFSRIILVFNISFVVPHVDKDVAKAIQAARQKLGMTQKDLAAVRKR